jgi:hypothetical protein
MYSVVCALFSLVEEAIQQTVFRTQWIIIRVEEGHSSPVVKTYNDPFNGIHRELWHYYGGLTLHAVLTRLAEAEFMNVQFR